MVHRRSCSANCCRVSNYKRPGLFVLLPDAGAFGMNGAAFAALGEMAVDFKLAAVPLVASNDGVKLGDSTFNRFFRLVEVEGGDQ